MSKLDAMSVAELHYDARHMVFFSSKSEIEKKTGKKVGHRVFIRGRDTVVEFIYVRTGKNRDYYKPLLVKRRPRNPLADQVRLIIGHN